MKLIGRNKVLVAPLDWGLGHASRCIPLIEALVKEGKEVLIAANGPIKTLIQQEFPKIEYIPLPGYSIKYSKTKAGLFFKIIKQIPKILISIYSEHQWLKEVVRNFEIDIVISDNRYGLYNKEIYSVLITHQLTIKSFFYQKVLRKINYQFINKFDECWVPDFEDEPNIAGELSHPKQLPAIPVRYIGLLSRFQKPGKGDAKYLLILLSGPEPQRSIFEEIIIKQLANYSLPVIIARGLPGCDIALVVKPNVTCFNHLPAKEMEKVICNASFVIARSGYSTIMDLLKLKKKTILIPTPGQTEQEYLARHLFHQQLAFTTSQQNFDLQKTLLSASVFNYLFFEKEDLTILQNAILFEEQHSPQV